MKKHSFVPRKPSKAAHALLAAFAGVNLAGAAALTWDINATNGATIDAGNGTWNPTAGNTAWNNAGSNFIWSQTSSTSPTNSATFGGTDGTYTIAVGTGVAASSISFLNSGYTFSAASAQQIFLTASPLTVAGSISIASGKSATIGGNSTIDGGLTKLGGGTLTLTSASAYTGPADITAASYNGPTTVY